MILSSRNNLFTFSFPSKFVPDEINSKYNAYLNRMPGNLIHNPVDYINYSVQSFNVPGVAYDPVSQTGLYGRERKYRSSIDAMEVFSKTFTITFQMLDGFINYWMMLDIFNYYYSFDNTDKYLPEPIMIKILDAEGNVIVVMQLERVLFNGLSELNLSYSSNTVEFQTFDADFTYNSFSLDIKIGGVN